MSRVPTISKGFTGKPLTVASLGVMKTVQMRTLYSNEAICFLCDYGFQ